MVKSKLSNNTFYKNIWFGLKVYTVEILRFKPSFVKKRKQLNIYTI